MSKTGNHGVDQMRLRTGWGLWIVGSMVLELLLLKVVSLGDVRQHLVEALAVYLVSFTVYLICVYAAYKVPVHGGWGSRAGAVVLAALVFRLTVWPLAPPFSDDTIRYRWEGKLQAAGGNPYQVAPNDPAWEHLRDETWPRMVTPEAKAGYGPLLELGQAGWYQFVSSKWPDTWSQVFWFKLPGALLDLGVIGALLWLLRARDLAPERLLVYAWSPLSVMEFWATGHNDPWALVFVVIAAALAVKGRWVASFASLGLGIAAKLWPVLLVPVFVGWKGWHPARWWQWLAAPGVAILCFLPYWSDVERNARYVSGFVGGWRNNDSAYGLLLWITGNQYPAKYTAFTLAGLWILWVVVRGWPLEKASLGAIAGLLVVSANVHPWYLTWLLPFLVVTPSSGLLLWTALAPLAYGVLIPYYGLGVWQGVTPMRWLIYGPVFGVLAWEAWHAWRAKVADVSRSG